MLWSLFLYRSRYVFVPSTGTHARYKKLAIEISLKLDEGRMWAEGNIRIGEIILLIDCDNRAVSSI